MRYAFLFLFVAILAAVYGWIVNLIDVIHMAQSGAGLTAMFVLRIVGIPLAGLGALLGYF